MTYAIAARRLTVQFPGQPRPALHEVDILIPNGGFVAVVGPSGSGKSTLLNCFAGLIRPTKGKVTADRELVVNPSPERGVVFQRDILFPWTTIEGNLRFALRAARVPRHAHDERIDGLLRAVRLSSTVRALRPYELSGGMRQRVGIARMLAHSPPIMLMDEPFGALDAQTRLIMQDLIIDLWEERRSTIVFVTHDVEEALRLADTIIVLSAGGTVRAEIANILPRPRSVSKMVELPGYASLRRSLYENLNVHAVPAPFVPSKYEGSSSWNRTPYVTRF
jgi:ABC-type nitrate/sulfonate/bicarbonate transport system ATPase subunit